MVDQALLKEHMWDSAKEIFETMIALPVERGDSNVELEASQSMVCVISFKGRLERSFSACCARACAEKNGTLVLIKPCLWSEGILCGLE